MSGRRLLAVVLVAVCVTMAGCGASRPPGAASVRSTVHTLLADLGSANGSGFCTLLSPALRDQLAGLGPRHTCAATMTSLAAALPSKRRAALLHAEVGHVVVHGSTAVVSAADITTTHGTLQGFLSSADGPTALRRRADGSWRFTG